MKNPEPLIFSALLVVTLGGAYVVHEGAQQAPVSEGEVVILAPTGANTVSAVLWEGGGTSARLEHRGEEAIPWVTWTFQVGGAADLVPEEPEGDGHDHGHDHDHHPDDEDGAPPEILEGGALAKRIFPGNQDAKNLLAFYEPLKAVRRFDSLTETALGEMGFDDPEERLTVFHGEVPHVFDIGSGAYGSDHVYIRPEGGGPTYLVKSQGIRPLRRAPMRLMERDALGVDLRDVAGAAVTRPGAPILKVLYRGGRDKASAFWALETSPGEEESRIGGFMDALFKARVASYPIEGEAMPEVQEAAKISFFDEDGQELGGAALGWGDVEDQIGFIWSPRIGRWVPLPGAAGIDLADTLRDLGEL